MRKRGYQDEELIRILQQKAKELGRTPHVYDMKKPSYRTFCNRFGLWADALKAAGLYPSRGYSNEELILLLQQKAEELGRSPHMCDMKKPSYGTYCRIFGSWTNALKAAGLGISTKSKKYSNEELILILRQKAKELGRTPRTRDMKRPSAPTFYITFGSWNNALRSAGLKTNSRRKYNDKELILILQQKAEELGRSPHMCDMKKPSYGTFCNRFGSWADALKAAGLDISTKGKKYSNEELILLLQQKAEELGRTPHVYDMKKPSYRTYCRIFGTWNKALEAAGLKS